MRLTVLGAGTSIPAAQHSPPGLFVRIGREQILLDCGPGTLQRLHQTGGSLFALDRIFLTHAHVDHCLDVVAALFALRIPRPAGSPAQSLTIYGPRGLRALVRRLNIAFHGWLTPRGYRLAIRELGQTTLRLPGYRVTTHSMRHSTTALGYRLEQADGRSLAYSGDTDVCPEVIRLGKGADVLVLECSMTDERKVAGHLTPSECGRIAAQTGCRHLVLTHFYPIFARYDIRARVRRAFQGRLTLARDGTSLTL